MKTITQRLLSGEARVRLEDMRSGRMDDNAWTRLAKRTVEISEAPLVITRPDNVEIGPLTDAIKTLSAQRQVRLVVIDSLHLVTARRDLPYENREREIAEVTRRLNARVWRLRWAARPASGVSACALSRRTYTRTRRRTTAADLAGSCASSATTKACRIRLDGSCSATPWACASWPPAPCLFVAGRM